LQSQNASAQILAAINHSASNIHPSIIAAEGTPVAVVFTTSYGIVVVGSHLSPEDFSFLLLLFPLFIAVDEYVDAQSKHPSNM
jgi:hypothetical protein